MSPVQTGYIVTSPTDRRRGHPCHLVRATRRDPLTVALMPWEETDAVKQRVKFLLKRESHWREGGGRTDFSAAAGWRRGSYGSLGARRLHVSPLPT